MPRDDELQAVVDHSSIERLQRAYADGVTRRDWAAVRGLFLPDASVSLDLVTRPAVQLAGPDELVSFVSGALERFSFFQFVILNSHIDLWPRGHRSVATARVFMCELRQDVGATERNDSYGLYCDTYRQVDGDGFGGWRFATRTYRSMARYPAGEVFPLDA